MMSMFQIEDVPIESRMLVSFAQVVSESSCCIPGSCTGHFTAQSSCIFKLQISHLLIEKQNV